MKKNFVKIYIALFAVVLASCLDDSSSALDPKGTQNIIEFLDNSGPSNPAGAVYPVWTATSEIVPDFVFQQTIRYSGPNSNDSDIALTLAIDPLALDEYNLQMATLGGGTYNMMPTTYFDFSDFNVTIPKGQQEVNISITAHPDKFDLTKNFALPLRIVSASSGIISAHYSVAILAVVVKNQYDGVYDIIGGSITRNSATGPDTALGGVYDKGLTMDLATVNGNTVAIVPLWKDGSGVGGVAGTTLAISTTNLVTVKSSGNALLKNTPATVNAYDPATKTFTLSFDWGTGANTRIVAGLMIKFKKPRP
jgi:hypothetical protein